MHLIKISALVRMLGVRTAIEFLAIHSLKIRNGKIDVSLRVAIRPAGKNVPSESYLACLFSSSLYLHRIYVKKKAKTCL